jgi:AbiTii
MRVADSTVQQLNNALYHLYSDDPLEDCLHEYIAVGVALRADELIDWARCELTGYPKDAEVPNYRFTKVQLIGVERSEQSVATGPVGLDEFDTSDWKVVTANKKAVPWSVGDIARAVTKANENHESYIIVSLLASADQLLKEGHRSYTQVYWGVFRGSLDGILQAVRNTGITMLEALTKNGEAEGSGPGRQDSSQAMAVVMAGKRNRINVTTNQSGAGNPEVGDDENVSRRSLAWARWQVYLAAVGLLLMAVGVVLAYLALH